MREDLFDELNSALQTIIRHGKGGMSRRHARAVSDCLGVEIGPYVLPVLTELSEGPLRPSDLAQRLGITRPALSWRMRQMEHMGLISRTDGEKDLRTVLVQTTAKGKQLADSGEVQRRQELQRLLAKWPDETLAMLIALLADLDRDLS